MERTLLMDLGGLTRYGSEDAEIRPPEARRKSRGVSGRPDHRTLGPGEAKFFPGKPYINRGIANQTTRRC